MIKIGDRYYDWEIIEKGLGKQYKGEKNLRTSWVCKCHCGYCDNIIRDVLEKNLKTGTSKGCGTKSKHLNGKSNKKENSYDIENDHIVIRTKSENYIIDSEDFDLVIKYCWSVLSLKNKYAVTKIKNTHDKYDNLFLHNLIMGNLNKEYVVDHIDGNILNNRKSNLRLTTLNLNAKNLKTYKTNTSGTKGVCFDKKHGQWTAYIQCNKKRMFLGRFDDVNEAIRARKVAEIKHFGEYSRDYKEE